MISRILANRWPAAVRWNAIGLALWLAPVAVAQSQTSPVTSLDSKETAQLPIVERKLSLKRVDQGSVQTARKTGDVSGAWSGMPFPYLILREDGGKFTGTVGRSEHAQSPILDLDVRDGVVRFTLNKPTPDTSIKLELTLKDNQLLEGFIQLTAVGAISGELSAKLDDPSIEYTSRPLTDLASELNRRIQSGEVRLKRDRTHGYLRSVLEAFDVPIESQVAVFSKTSLQRKFINPRNPRTVFFNDEVSIGWIRGGELIEVAALDPQQGVIFYQLDQKRADNPQFKRSDSACLGCHQGVTTLDVPGLTVRSVYPVSTGMVMGGAGSVDHRVPMERRWGGWYVTGEHGSARHLGNAVVTDADKPRSMVSDATLNLASLKDKFDTRGYLSPHSDIVALMVLDHQAHMTNLLTRMGWETRLALRSDGPDSLAQRLRDGSRQLVDYMLFVDEAPLADKIQGASGFAEKFAAKGPHDRQGRSLRQFDLEKRLFRYPCSFMIYSRAFDGLPAEAKDAIYQRMWQVLSGEEKNERYGRLSLSDRQDIIEILCESKKDLPGYFRPAGLSAALRP